MKVFLGGTCNGSKWRDELIPMLTCEYFNPVVEDWTPECQTEEIRQRKECDLVLYTISKEMTGAYSIAEAVDDSNKRPRTTVLCLLFDGFGESQEKSLRSVGNMVAKNGAYVLYNLRSLAGFLNAAHRNHQATKDGS